MSKKTKIAPVPKWTTANIANGLGDKDKFRFPKSGIRLARPVVVRNTSSTKKRVVAPSFVETEGQSKAINTSDSILEKLGVEGNRGTIEYGTATFWDVVCAKKWALIAAVLACVVAIGGIVIAVAAFYPTEHAAELIMWGAAVVVGVIGLVFCGYSLRSVYKEAIG